MSPVTGHEIAGSIRDFPGQSLPCDRPAVPWQIQAAGLGEEPAPAVCQSMLVIGKRRKDRSGKNSKQGISHKGDFIVDDNAEAAA